MPPVSCGRLFSHRPTLQAMPNDTDDEKKGLSQAAYVELEAGQQYPPYVAPAQSLPEFSLKAAFFGILFGIVFGAANAYLGLRAGLTISTSIPVAVMTVAAFRALKSVGYPGSILEANLSQTIGSASSSLASGVIFTLPALFLWGVAPGLLQMTLLAMCGGLIGVLFMIPLRRFLIKGEHGRLPYPEGTACAEVLVTSETGGRNARYVFYGWLPPGAGLRAGEDPLAAFCGGCLSAGFDYDTIVHRRAVARPVRKARGISVRRGGLPRAGCAARQRVRRRRRPARRRHCGSGFRAGCKARRYRSRVAGPAPSGADRRAAGLRFSHRGLRAPRQALNAAATAGGS
jgi:hypothetical protein